MQPIGNAWNKLPRLVRDLSREMDKKIELTMLGADTELDRQVLELIKDPLTHMVRNSGDHGLESPAERRSAGKPEAGHITLNAYHEGGHIIIEISDDGRGLPLDKIRAKVLKNGLATDAQLAGISERQLQSAVSRAGFSTPPMVPAGSRRRHGRGEDQHREDRRHDRPEERAGRRCHLHHQDPLTLAIVSALIVEGRRRFAIPQISVVELVSAQKEAGAQPQRDRLGDRYRADQRHAGAALRDRLLPLVNPTTCWRLADHATTYRRLHCRGSGGGEQSRHHRRSRVRHRRDRGEAGGADLRHVTMFSGNTIPGDG
jgi:two-component system chemotaxis sensor kinase CheA